MDSQPAQHMVPGDTIEHTTVRVLRQSPNWLEGAFGKAGEYQLDLVRKRPGQDWRFVIKWGPGRIVGKVEGTHTMSEAVVQAIHIAQLEPEGLSADG